MIKKLYKNWTMHNLISHPLSEIIYIIGFGTGRAEKFCNWIHDITIPDHIPGTGRG